MAATRPKAKKKRKGRRLPNSPGQQETDPRARILPDLTALIAAVGERSVNDMSELDVARMRRFALDHVYSGKWCRQRARLVWLGLEKLAQDMAELDYPEVSARMLPLVRRSMPVGTAYAELLDSARSGGPVRIGWSNQSDAEEAILTNEHRIMSAYATRADWEVIRELCEPYRVGRDIYEVTALLPFACGWVLPAAVHDRAWRTRSVPGMQLLRELASDLQRRVFVNLTVEDILNGTVAVVEWAERHVAADADDIEPGPEFLSLEEVLSIHAEQLQRFGGTDGVRDPNVLESAAIGQPQAVFSFLVGADVYDIAAAYAFHISEGQPFLDGNKRTALNAALLFLAMNNAKLPRDDRGQLYTAMIDVANGRLTRAGLADTFRSLAG